MSRKGHFVAVTGDGVNDAPALKESKYWRCYGISKFMLEIDTSAMIVTMIPFPRLLQGLKKERVAYDNIRKVTYLLVSTGLAEVVLFILALLAGLSIPLIAVQLLWLNLVTNGIQGVALAFQRPENPEP